MVSETRNIGLPYQRKWRVQIHTKINTSNGSDFDTVGTYDFCCGNVGVRPGGGVICVALSWRTSGHWFPFLVGFSPWPLSGSVLERAGAILGWHGQGSWLNFICSLHISLSLFHKSSCCHQSATSCLSAASIFHFHFPHIILLPSSCTCLTTACHPGISSPPRPPSTERPLGMSFSLPYPSLSLSREQVSHTQLVEQYNPKMYNILLLIFLSPFTTYFTTFSTTYSSPFTLFLLISPVWFLKLSTCNIRLLVRSQLNL